jgi:tetratricopeptide (TPR) repeat protein
MIRDARSTKAAGEISRKEMKGPDRFQVLATHAAEWMAKNRKPILVAGAAGVVALVVAIGASAAIRSSREKAGGSLYRALDAADGQISPVPLPGVDRMIFKSDAERQRAVVEAATAVRSGHPGTRAALTAALVAGDAHLALGEWDAAASAFQEYLAAAPGDDPLRFAALQGLARVQEGKGDLAGAAQSWERVGREAPPYGDRAAIERARVLARAGQTEAARKVLQGFAVEFKDSALQGEVQERLARLGGK